MLHLLSLLEKGKLAGIRYLLEQPRPPPPPKSLRFGRIAEGDPILKFSPRKIVGFGVQSRLNQKPEFLNIPATLHFHRLRLGVLGFFQAEVSTILKPKL